MKLTRKILIEKSSKFWLYNNPNDVPDIVWEKSYCEINNNSSSYEEILDYILKNILCPLFNKRYFTIYNIVEVSSIPLIDIRFMDNLNNFNFGYDFRIFTSTINNIVIFQQHIKLKEFICTHYDYNLIVNIKNESRINNNT